jgi:quercetin dioxygenase-like cupin family protein
MKITRLENCEKTPVRIDGALDAFRQVPVGRADGSENIAFRVFTVKPGGHTPHHAHESEHLNYIIGGEGEVMDGETTRPVRQGDFVFVEPDKLHQYRNTGDEPLVFICAVLGKYE